MGLTAGSDPTLCTQRTAPTGVAEEFFTEKPPQEPIFLSDSCASLTLFSFFFSPREWLSKIGVPGKSQQLPYF